MSVLVTGGTGFIGSYIVRELLQKNEKVVTFDNLPSNTIKDVLSKEELASISQVTGDISSFQELAKAIHEHKVERVVHLASLLHPKCDANPEQAINVNIIGQQNMLEAIRLFGLKKLVWASSVVVFGPRTKHKTLPVPNDAPHFPTNIYGATKSFDEFLASHYRKQWNLDIIGLRLTIVYGPGRLRGATAFVNQMIEQVALGKEEVVVKFADDVIDWQYVEDVARLFTKCLYVEKTKSTVFNTKFDLRSVREGAIYLNKLFPTVKFTYEPGEFGIAWNLDDSTLQEEVGFKPIYNMESGITKTINTLRAKHGLALIEDK